MVLKYDIFLFLLLLKFLLYGITDTQTRIIYYSRACITIVYITVSFILPLIRSLLTILGLRAQVGDPRYCIVRYFIGFTRLVIETIHKYLYYLVFSSLFFHISISIMITNPFLQLLLYLFNAGILVYMEAISCTEA